MCVWDIGLLYPLAVLGMIAVWGSGGIARIKVGFLVGLFVAYVGILSLTVTEIRYRWPVMPIVMVLAAFGWLQARGLVFPGRGSRLNER
jgi:hypothetical protein